MGAINSALKQLTVAVNAGYKHGSVFTVRAPAKDGNPDPQYSGEELTEDKVSEWVTICEIAVKVLREVESTGLLKGKTLEVDRASVGVSTKTMALGMVSTVYMLPMRKTHGSTAVLWSSCQRTEPC
jgi:hypothetical protein